MHLDQFLYTRETGLILVASGYKSHFCVCSPTPPLCVLLYIHICVCVFEDLQVTSTAAATTATPVSAVHQTVNAAM